MEIRIPVDHDAIQRTIMNQASSGERSEVYEKSRNLENWHFQYNKVAGGTFDRPIWAFMIQDLLGILYVADHAKRVVSPHAYTMMQGDPSKITDAVEGRFPGTNLTYLGKVPLCKHATTVVTAVEGQTTSQVQAFLDECEGETCDSMMQGHIMAAEIITITAGIRHQLFYDGRPILLEVVPDREMKEPIFQIYTPEHSIKPAYSDKSFPSLSAALQQVTEAP